jgi:hypothetical protein
MTTAITYAGKATVAVSEATVEAILRNDGTSAWAEEGAWSAGTQSVTWWERRMVREDGGTRWVVADSVRHRTTYAEIADALVQVAAGILPGGWEVPAVIADQARDIIRDAETYAVGAEACDVILQVAMFGEVRYG